MLGAVKAGILDAIYPPRCLACPEPTDAPHGLCSACWRDTHFIADAACDKCGAPLIGEAGAGDLCERCTSHPPAWDRGAAGIVYSGAGRRVVLAFKHGDRLDMVGPFAGWVARAGAPLLNDADLFVPVPLHWSRLMRRKYNQAGLLAQTIGKCLNRPVHVNALQRTHRTPSLDGAGKDARFATLADVIAPHPRRGPRLAGKDVLLVDDVMTSGATLAACAEAVHKAGAGLVNVVTLARVVKDA